MPDDRQPPPPLWFRVAVLAGMAAAAGVVLLAVGPG